ncbi:phosphoserine phosphatase [Ophiocordyceps camponoti-floridani]|uniref:Phosphoserine phosphatase n=1 Tax=Ophiocordyceps camponoti-floridani TaxID=2030778 RepID=A0A8H4VFU4_9HYPO|nr:phosphoserine phosphatase [Ophiocordyceps camponoti-floridani]
MEAPMTAFTTARVLPLTTTKVERSSHPRLIFSSADFASVLHSDTPAMATSPQFIFFTDFDGTITMNDSNDIIVDHFGAGLERRLQGSLDTLNGRISFREFYQEMMDLISAPFDQCLDLLLRNVRLDPGFREFYSWAHDNNVPVVILSGGMEPVIRALLDNLLGEDAWDIQIVSNDIRPRYPGRSINEPEGWTIQFRDGTVHGHDKSVEIRKYSSLPDRPVLFYAGDGVSDLSAARETDLLFAKADKELVAYCEREEVPFVTYRNWTSITQTCEDIVAGTITVQDAARGRF